MHHSMPAACSYARHQTPLTSPSTPSHKRTHTCDEQDIKAMEVMRKVAGKFAKVDEIQAALASTCFV